jgi:2-oxoglutarate dehydrogenase E1 component
VFAAKVAVEYRQKFGRPVVIDMICYRRFGHNEGDEPSFTQPLMYSKIRAHKSTLELYSSKLVSEGLVTNDEVDQLKAEWRSKLEGEFDAGQDYRPNKADWLDGVWKDFKPAEQEGPRRGDTGVELDRLKSIGQSLTRVPEGFNVHKTVKRFLDNRLSAIESGEGIDWATAEALAFGSLVTEGHPVRLSGQDVERGTFSQRHSVLNDQQVDNKTYTPLNNLADDQCRYEVINSMLSEEAVLGFEYGYSLAEPKALTIWEAQFGDFVNGAQVVIDQFISSGERKWFRMSGLVMLLPHGYEGQGPEHSSARPERFLQLCAEDNMQVANCTTPANYFHALRRQVNRDFRKPLVLMTPKSLLRHKRAVSGLDEMGPDSCFHRLLWDDAEAPGVPKTTIKLSADDKIRRVVLCTGKVYYDLLEDREKRGIDDVYLLRVEQLYPFPAKAVLDELNRFKNADIIWCQEEPKNMGAWAFIQPYVEWVLDQMGRTNERVRYVGRPASASTATGLMRTHLAQLQAFLDEAFAQ